MEITIKKETLEYALNMIDTQFDHIENTPGKAAKDRQRAYWLGMREMISILITQGYTDDTYILWTDHDCKHSIKRRGDIK